jgi:hypothetical protein
MSKRRRSAYLLADEEPDLLIQVADRPQPFTAHWDLLRLYSIVVADLPRAGDGNATLWNLANLVLEGEAVPVKMEVVKQWLDLIYSHVDSSRKLKLRPFKKLDDARPLLIFADAVGTCDAAMALLCGAVLADKQGLQLEVPLGQTGVKVEISLPRGRIYRATQGDGLVYVDAARPCERVVVVRPAVFRPHVAAFITNLQQQLEAWLHLAGRLQLDPLVRRLIGFIKEQLVLAGESVVGSAMDVVYSPRVIQCMPRAVLYEGFLRDALLHRTHEVQISAEPTEDAGIGFVKATGSAVAALQLASHGALAVPAGGHLVVDSLMAGEGVACGKLMVRNGEMDITVVPISVSVGGPTQLWCERSVRKIVDKATER